LGCVIPARLNSYDAATRRIAEVLGVELVDIEGAICCSSPDMESMSEETGLAMAAYNISIAEEMNLDIMVLCNGCNEVLVKANKKLKENKKLQDKVNNVLADLGRKYNGTIEVKHLVRVLYEDFGVEKIKKKIKKPFKNLKVAVHYGCHLIKPSEFLMFDNPENPKSLDELVNITGARSVNYPDKMECCGGPILAVNEDLSLNIARSKIEVVKKYADVIVTACPFCYLQYENCQLLSGEKEQIPVVLYPQLLGLALGIDYDDLALYENRIDASILLEHL